MKKLLAILLAAAMLFALAACGDKTTGDTTTTTAAEEITDAPVEESTDAPVEDTSAADTSDVSAEEPSSEDPSAAEEETTAANADMTKAEFVAFLNAETAKIAKSGSYNANRNCSYTDPIDVGGATDTLNGIISAIDENENLDTVVGGFLGIGTNKASVPKEDFDEDYKLQATSLKEGDLGSFSSKDGVYSFTLAKATDPKKTGATPLSRFTKDFITHEEVVDGIADFTTAIKVKSTTVNYTNIKVEVTVEEGKITNIEYSYSFDAVLSLTALVVPINGNGAAKTVATYSNIKY